MTKTEMIAAEALTLLREMLDDHVFGNAWAWHEDHGEYDSSAQMTKYEERAEALLKGQVNADQEESDSTTGPDEADDSSVTEA